MQFASVNAAVVGTITVAGQVTIADILAGTVDIGTVGSITAGEIDLTVLTQAGVAGQISVAGAPPIDQETQLYVNTVLPAGLNSFGPFDISKANSVTAQIFGGTQPQKVEFTFENPNGFVLENIGFEVDSNCAIYVDMPAIGTKVIASTNIGAGGGSAGQLLISSSTRVVPKVTTHHSAPLGITTVFTSVTQIDGDDNEFAFTGTLTTGSTGHLKPSFRAGPIQISLYSGGAAPNTSTFTVQTGAGINVAVSTFPDAAFTPKIVNIVLPRKTVDFAVKNNTGATVAYTVDVISQD